MLSFANGWVEIGARNHIVVKKNFTFVILLDANSASHKIAAKNNPVTITIIVRYLYVSGKINTCGEKGKKADWNSAPPIIAANVKIDVAQFT
jgi:hypothetical protein